MYVTKRDKIKKQMKNKTYKTMPVGYADNHTRYTYNLYNPETKRFIMTRIIKWVEWKIIDPSETMKMFHNSNKDYVTIVIEE